MTTTDLQSHHGTAALARGFWPVILTLIAAVGAIEIVSMRGQSQTWDEGFEIASGYSFLRTGSYRISMEHPPLARLLAAMPLMWLNPSVPVGDTSWAKSEDVNFGSAFLYRNHVPADSILFAARIPGVITAGLLVLAVAWWTRRTFGVKAGLLAAFLVALDPNVIASARVVKNDILVSLLGFLSVVSWVEYRRTRRPVWLAATGIAFGLAMTTKFSALYLIAVFVVLWAWPVRTESMTSYLRSAARGAVSLAIIALMTVAAVALVYGPEWRKLIPATQAYRAAHPEARRLSDFVWPETHAAQNVIRLSHRFGIQDHPFWYGLVIFLEHSGHGHQAYLLGKVNETGWWYYFPIAFLVKTPVATLGVLLLAFGLAIRHWVRSPAGWLRSLGLEWWTCVVPLALYAAAAAANKVNTGERHLLPVYPFLFAAASAIAANVAWPKREPVVAVLAVLLAAESMLVYPHFLSFFNVAVGGPSAGSRYLLDSNLDWGQDLLRLRDDWMARGRPRLCLLYFGTAPPEYYGLQGDYVPPTDKEQERRSLNCIAAVSLTPLNGLYVPRRDLDWLRERTPFGRIGYSMNLYDLRQDGAR